MTISHHFRGSLVRANGDIGWTFIIIIIIIVMRFPFSMKSSVLGQNMPFLASRTEKPNYINSQLVQCPDSPVVAACKARIQIFAEPNSALFFHRTCRYNCYLEMDHNLRSRFPHSPTNQKKNINKIPPLKHKNKKL